jgi:alcohol dehydrogenase class IV
VLWIGDKDMIFSNWSYPTEIRFGEGRIKELVEVCQLNNINRPLFVTDHGLLGLETTHDVIKVMKANFSCEVFSDVDSNPTEKNLISGVEAFKFGQHDGVVAFGGGSGLDVGKLIAFMTPQSRPVWDFEDRGDWWKRASADKISPIIAIPTTAGTGSEVGRASVLTNSISKEKKIIFHPKILPSTVICDPALTLSLPKKITAGTGLDALAHCVEAYCSPAFHPMSQGIALEGIKLVKENLLRVYNNGNDVLARSHMMSAALMGAVAFQKGLGAIHAISHPIGAMFNSHHGLTNAVLMPSVLRFNSKEIKAKIDIMAEYLEIKNGLDGFLSFIDKLNSDLSVPKSLATFGVTLDDVDKIIEGAMKDPSTTGNPKKLTKENLRSLIINAL